MNKSLVFLTFGIILHFMPGVHHIANAQWMQTSGPKWFTGTDSLYAQTIGLLTYRKPNGDTILFAGTLEGVYLSSDEGDSWMLRTPASGEINNGQVIHCLAQYNTTVLAGLYDGTDANLYQSTNEGETWSRIIIDSVLGKVNVNDICITPASSDVDKIFVATQELGVCLSIDGGKKWERRNNGFYLEDSLNGLKVTYSVEAIALQGDSSVLLAGTARGVYRSTDEGRTWMPSNDGLPYAASQMLWPVRDFETVIVEGVDTLAFIATNYGVYRSGDFGESWQRKSSGLPLWPSAGTSVESIISVPWQDPIPLLFASVRRTDTTVCMSTDLGESWISISGNLQSNAIKEPLLYANSFLFVGLYSIYSASQSYNGVWRRSLDDILTTGVDEPGIVPVSTQLHSYPNPVASGAPVTVTYTLERAAAVTLKVQDVLGRTVHEEALGALPPGEHTRTLPTSSLKPGMYFYTLLPGEGKPLVGKVVVAK